MSSIKESVSELNNMILEGKIKSTGVHIPIARDIYEPILEELEKFDIRFVEETFFVPEPESV